MRPTPKKYYILAAIDGTGSKDWLQKNKGYSHTKNFMKQFGSSDPYYFSMYWHGPTNTGENSLAIANDVIGWINSCISFLGNKYKMSIPLCVCLVGHSRGGAIAIHVAKKLNCQVYFMGLYDAVDRARQVDGDFIRNTKHIYHAMRGMVESRPSFGNCGLFGETRVHKMKFFTSHGGVGGAPEFDYNKIGAFGDYSCSNKIIRYVTTGSAGSDFAGGSPLQTRQITINRPKELVQKCKNGSSQAHEWMVRNAKAIGLPI